jgi:hypothetical protein
LREPNDTPAQAVPLALGESIAAGLCLGDVDVYAVTLAAGDELQVDLEVDGAGWPALAIDDDRGAVMALRTLEPTNAGFADHDGTYYVVVDGVAARAGTPYRVTATLRAGPHWFVSPGGNDASPGTFAQPWLRLDTALGKLAPGDTLVLEDGAYTPAANGALVFSCANGVANGTQAQPIRVSAVHERLAELDGTGDQAAIEIDDCAWWTIERLHLESADLAGSSNGEALTADRDSNLTLRRMLAAHNNRYTNSHVIDIGTSSNVLVEECEVYDFHRDGIELWESTDAEIRRSYAGSRGRADIAGGFVSSNPSRGDSGLSLALSTNALAENDVDEGNDSMGVDAGYGYDSMNALILGCASLGDVYGLVSTLETGPGDNRMTHVEDVAGVASSGVGQYVRSNLGFTCTGCMSVGSLDGGWQADEIATAPRPTASASCTACLELNGAGIGFNIQNQGGGWQLDHVNSFGNATAFSPSTGSELVAVTQIDPQLGGCLVYVPASSPMHGAGPGGRDIGANVAYRYRDGVLTGVPLWDPETGAFPCGAVVPGVNDDPNTACIGVHQRLHVGTPDCALPFPAP